MYTHGGVGRAKALSAPPSLRLGQNIMDNFEVIKSILIAMVRVGLIALFGWFIAKGYVTEAQLTTAAPIVTGFIIVVVGIIIRKIKTKYRIEAALELPANSTPAEVKQLAVEKNPLPNIIS